MTKTEASGVKIGASRARIGGLGVNFRASGAKIGDFGVKNQGY